MLIKILLKLSVLKELYISFTFICNYAKIVKSVVKSYQKIQLLSYIFYNYNTIAGLVEVCRDFQKREMLINRVFFERVY